MSQLELLDTGGVSCISCARNSGLQPVNNFTILFKLPFMFATMQTHENIAPLLIFTTPLNASLYIMLDIRP